MSRHDCRTRRRVLHWVLASALGAVLTLSSAGILESQESSIPVVTITAGAPELKGEIPFDQVFVLSGAVDSLVQKVEVWRYELTSLTQTKSCSDAAGKTDVGVWEATPGVKAANFSVLAQPVSANKIFKFCVQSTTRLSKAALDSQRARLRGALDGQYQRIGNPATLSQAQLDQIRTAVLAVLPKDGLQPRPRPGTLLDDSADGQTAARGVLQSAAIRQAQANRSNAVTNFGIQSTNAANALQAARDDPGTLAVENHLADLAPLLTRASAQNNLAPAQRAALFDGARLAGRLATLDALQIDLIAQGLRTADGAVTCSRRLLSDTWAADSVLTCRAEAIRAAWQTVQDLASLARAAASIPDASPTPSERVALAAVESALGTAGQALNFAAAQLDDLSRALAQRTAALQSVVAAYSAELIVSYELVGTTHGTFVSRANWYISADVGVLAVPGLDVVAPFAGVNVYFTPVNKNVPLGLADGPWKRTSLILGVTLTSVAEENKRQDLFGKRAGVVGIGVRLLDSVRLGAGAVVFKSQDGSALVTDVDFDASGFLSLSIDWDIQETLGKLGSVLF